MDEGRGRGRVQKLFEDFFNKKGKKPYRSDLHIFLEALYGSEYYCEDFIRSSHF
jgi:hypothetical protein